MIQNALQNSTILDDVGAHMYRLISDLYPLCRSITGNGVRDTLKLLQQHIPLKVHEIPTGTPVFDWTIPKEWNITDAYIRNSKGERLVDFQKNNLHVMSYSVPVKKKISLDELKAHMFTLPEYPEWIPYRTSYYEENWAFCLSHNQIAALTDGEYEVLIDSTLQDGHLSYGEYSVTGQTADEILISCHICHPSLCNDNLSGVAVAAFLAKYLTYQKVHYSYRFLFIPGTIGSIAWLSLNEARVSRIKHGLVLACVGDAGGFTYKKSRLGNAEVDRAAAHVLCHSRQEHKILEFSPYGYDERQFGSPGFNLPVGCFMRTPHGEFPEYHTSADNLQFVKPEYLADSFAKCRSIFDILENNRTYLNQNPKCEPQLGKRGLYEAIGGAESKKLRELAMLWVLNLSDGNASLLDIAERSGIEFDTIKAAADALLEYRLLK